MSLLNRWGRRAALQALLWALVISIAGAWFFTLRPQQLGGPAEFIRVNGISMTPTLRNGDLAVVERQSSYHRGEVIAYRIPVGQPGAGSNVIHRIVAGNGTTGFITKGDHNSFTDQFWHPRTADVIGRVWAHVPKVANVLARLHTPAVLALVVGIAAFFLLAWPDKLPHTGVHS